MEDAKADAHDPFDEKIALNNKKVLDSIKSSGDTESKKFDAKHDYWYARDMAARKEKLDAEARKCGGHVKTELDDKIEKEVKADKKEKEKE